MVVVERNFDIRRQLRDAEAQRSKLFAMAWGDLGHMRGKSRTYYVCAVSGYVMETSDASKCSDGKYETIK